MDANEESGSEEEEDEDNLTLGQLCKQVMSNLREQGAEIPVSDGEEEQEVETEEEEDYVEEEDTDDDDDVIEVL